MTTDGGTDRQNRRAENNRAPNEMVFCFQVFTSTRLGDSLEDMLLKFLDGVPRVVQITGWLQTHGTPAGEIKDSSKSSVDMMNAE